MRVSLRGIGTVPIAVASTLKLMEARRINYPFLALKITRMEHENQAKNLVKTPNPVRSPLGYMIRQLGAKLG
jgi:hypothetical protein